MHELSIVESVIEVVCKSAREHQAKAIDSVHLEIGELSPIDLSALRFAWDHAVPQTALATTGCNITIVAGKARCALCNIEYPMPTYYTACPSCGTYGNDITAGKDMVIKSITMH